MRIMNSNDFLWHSKNEVMDHHDFHMLIDPLKAYLKNSPVPFTMNPLAAWRFLPDASGRGLLFNPAGGSSNIDQAKLPMADPDLPAIAALIPSHRSSIGEVVWRFDIVDGNHRMARAIQDGRSDMAVIAVIPRVSFPVTFVEHHMRGAISTESFPSSPAAHAMVVGLLPTLGTAFPR